MLDHRAGRLHEPGCRKCATARKSRLATPKLFSRSHPRKHPRNCSFFSRAIFPPSSAPLYLKGIPTDPCEHQERSVGLRPSRGQPMRNKSMLRNSSKLVGLHVPPNGFTLVGFKRTLLSA
eukprot:7078293-Prymnesium_polylepis.1